MLCEERDCDDEVFYLLFGRRQHSVSTCPSTSSSILKSQRTIVHSHACAITRRHTGVKFDCSVPHSESVLVESVDTLKVIIAIQLLLHNAVCVLLFEITFGMMKKVRSRRGRRTLQCRFRNAWMRVYLLVIIVTNSS